MSGTGDMLLDMRSKYSDKEIKNSIEIARHLAGNDNWAGQANTAVAMIAYNKMIDQRWVRYYGLHLGKGVEAQFVEPDENYKETGDIDEGKR